MLPSSEFGLALRASDSEHLGGFMGLIGFIVFVGFMGMVGFKPDSRGLGV